jgi:hypothetical protein
LLAVAQSCNFLSRAAHIDDPDGHGHGGIAFSPTSAVFVSALFVLAFEETESLVISCVIGDFIPNLYGQP